MKKKLALLVTACLLSISMLSACGSNNASSSSTTTTAKAATKNDETAKSATEKVANNTSNTSATKKTTTAPGNVVNIQINAKDFTYDKKVIQVKKGDKVKITLHSDDGGHGLTIPAYNLDIQGNGSAEFTASKAGTFEFHCSVMCGDGHANMKGTLIVK